MKMNSFVASYCPYLVFFGEFWGVIKERGQNWRKIKSKKATKLTHNWKTSTNVYTYKLEAANRSKIKGKKRVGGKRKRQHT